MKQIKPLEYSICFTKEEKQRLNDYLVELEERIKRKVKIRRLG